MSRAYLVSVPKTREPFVNTPLLSLGAGRDGRERFWISDYNGNAGATCVLLTEGGDYRLYRFGTIYGGYASLCQQDKNTVWLCGDLSFVLRVKLDSGEYTKYDTGAQHWSANRGMALDPDTGKLFAMAAPKGVPMAFSFDTRKRKTARLYPNVSANHYQTTSFRNPNGTWTIVAGVPGFSVLEWDPKRETVKEIPLDDPSGKRPGFVAGPLRDARGRACFPGLGWYNPATHKCEKRGPRPEREAAWFAQRDGQAWGALVRDEDVEVLRWQLKTGKVTEVCRIPNCQLYNVNLTASGKIVAVSMFGIFYRFDAQSGGLECSRPLPVVGEGGLDCILRVDKERLLGTPYITQRFWELNLKTGQSTDCGRAAPKAGEILQVVRLRKKVYMAAYYGGELMEYDPAQPPRFPENPRVVAAPPSSMRPVSMANDGRNIYYSCNAPYGTLGATLTRYDTLTGQATWMKEPIPRRQILGLHCVPRTRSLYCGSAVHGDTYSCSPTVKNRAVYAHLDADTLAVRESVDAPDRVIRTYIAGPLDRRRFLVVTQADGGDRRWGVLQTSPLAAPRAGDLKALPVACPPIYAGKPGLFIFVVAGKRIELWDMLRERRARIVYRIPSSWPLSYRCVVQDNALYLAFPRKILIVEDLL